MTRDVQEESLEPMTDLLLCEVGDNKRCNLMSQGYTTPARYLHFRTPTGRYGAQTRLLKTLVAGGRTVCLPPLTVLEK